MKNVFLLICVISLTQATGLLRSAHAGTAQPSFDVDGDGSIAPADILAFVDHMRQYPLAERNPLFDFDYSGVVDEADTAALAEHIRALRGQQAASGATVGLRGAQPGSPSFVHQVAGSSVLTSIGLVPHTPGPYALGSSVDVDVVVTNHEGQAIQPRLIQFDFSATDPALSLPPTFNFQLVPPLATDGQYARFETMPIATVVYTGLSPAPGLILDIPDGGSIVLGTITVGLPAVAGSFFLDATNPNTPNLNFGARLDYGFDVRTTLHTLNLNLFGDPLELVVGLPCQVDTDCDDHNNCTVDICDVQANCVHEPIIGCVRVPATSVWGLSVMLLMAVAVGTRTFRERRAV